MSGLSPKPGVAKLLPKFQPKAGAPAQAQPKNIGFAAPVRHPVPASQENWNAPVRSAAPANKVDWNNSQNRDQLRQQATTQQQSNAAPMTLSPRGSLGVVRPSPPKGNSWRPIGYGSGASAAKGAAAAVGRPVTAPQLVHQQASYRPQVLRQQQPTPARPARPGMTPQPHLLPQVSAGPSTILIGGAGLMVLGEDAVSEACMKVAIDGGFSVPESVKISLQYQANVDFPHREAAEAFAAATMGQLIIRGQAFSVRHPAGGAGLPSRSATEMLKTLQTKTTEQLLAQSGSTPTDCIMVRQLGDADEQMLLNAFAGIAPRIKSVRIQRDIRGVTRGCGFVTFYEVYEATSALTQFRDSGCLVGTRHANADYATPQTLEQSLEKEHNDRKIVESQKKAQQSALQGPNANMWASYLSMFEDADAMATAQDEPETFVDEVAPGLVFAEIEEEDEPSAKRFKADELLSPLPFPEFPLPGMTGAAVGLQNSLHAAGLAGLPGMTGPRPSGLHGMTGPEPGLAGELPGEALPNLSFGGNLAFGNGVSQTVSGSSPPGLAPLAMPQPVTKRVTL